MRRLFRFSLVLGLLLGLGQGPALAQSVGIGTTAPDASAALDVVSSAKGALLPRLTQAARAALAAPAAGLLLYQTDGARPGFWYNAGGTGVGASPPVQWVRLTDSAGVSYDPSSGLQVGPGPVQSGGPFTVGPLSFAYSFPFSLDATLKVETVYTAAELVAAGMHPGPVLSLTYFISTKNSTTPFTNFTVRLGHTAAPAASTAYTPGLTLVYQANVTTTLGSNTLVFNQSPFSWDGTSSLVVQTCYANAAAGANDFSYAFSDTVNGLLYAYDCAGTTGSLSAARSQVRFEQQPGSYTLPAAGGTTSQVLTMQANGAAAWDDPAWLRNGIHAYRPPGTGTVGIASQSTRTRFSISPSLTEPKITLWDGGSSLAHYGFGVSSGQLNYHVSTTSDSHVFWAGGKNGDGAEAARLSGQGWLRVGSTGSGWGRLDVVNDGTSPNSNNAYAATLGIRNYLAGNANLSTLALQTARGTAAAPAPLQPFDLLGSMRFGGWLAGANYFPDVASITGQYLGNGRSTSLGGQLTFWPRGYHYPSSMSLDSAGRLTLGGFGVGESRLKLSPTLTEPKITLWDGNSATEHYGFGVSGFQLNYHVPGTGDNHVFWAGGRNGDNGLSGPAANRELARLSGTGYLRVGPPDNPALAPGRLTLVNDAGGGGQDDLVLRSYGSGTAPGLALQSFGGTPAAPANLVFGQFLGDIGMGGYVNGALGNFTLSSMQATYRGNGTTPLSDLSFYTGGLARLHLNELGNLGLGTTVPGARLDVVGAGTGTSMARLRVRSLNDQAGIGLVSDNTGEVVMYSPSGTDDLRLYVSGADRLSVTSAGNVGIGTTTPAASEALDVNGPARATEVHTPTTGSSNMLAVAYGQFSSNGTNAYSSSGNFTLSSQGAGHCRLTFTAASGLSTVAFGPLPVHVALFGSAPGFVSWNAAAGSGAIDVYTYDAAGTPVSRDFSIVVFRP